MVDISALKLVKTLIWKAKSFKDHFVLGHLLEKFPRILLFASFWMLLLLYDRFVTLAFLLRIRIWKHIQLNIFN